VLFDYIFLPLISYTHTTGMTHLKVKRVVTPFYLNSQYICDNNSTNEYL